jgi:hypothetical protein
MESTTRIHIRIVFVIKIRQILSEKIERREDVPKIVHHRDLKALQPIRWQFWHERLF